jgi:enoyl-CoA hydratase/carnithine racemase
VADAIAWSCDDDGIVTLTIDDPDQRVNTLNANFTESFANALDRLERERAGISGVIVRSGKDSFLAGADLRRLIDVQAAQRDAFVADVQLRKSRMRRLETLGRPVVAVLTGPALGGGCELALSCHRRIAVRDRASVGLPEVTLGLLPGSGGITRTVRLLGLDPVLEPVLLSGRVFPADEAHASGLVDELVASEDAALERARRWILANPTARQPWDVDGSRPGVVPGTLPTPTTTAGREIVRIAVSAATGDFDEAQRQESEALGDLVVSADVKRTIQVTFFDTARLRTRLRTAGRSTGAQVVLRVADERAAELLAHTAAAEFVVGPDVESTTGACELQVVGRRDGCELGPTEIRVHADRYTAGGVVLEYREVDEQVVGAVARLARAGVVAVPVTAGSFADAVTTAVDAGDHAELARAAVQLRDQGSLAHPEDLAVASVRLLGLPAATGGAEQLVADLAHTHA